MANLKFYKMAQAPVGTTEKPLEAGAIWFNTTNHSIEVYSGSTWSAFSGVLDAVVENEKLTVTKYDGSKVSVDFSIYATDEALELLTGRVTTLEGTVATQGGSITDLQGRMTTVEGKAKANEDKLAGLSEATVMAEIAKQVKVADDRAVAKENELAGKITTLETTVNTDHEGRIDALEALFGEGDGTVSDQIADAVKAAEDRVQEKLGKKVETSVYNEYVSKNDAAVAAVKKTAEDEVIRAQAAEAAINAKIGGSYGTEEGQVTVAADIQAAKDAAAEAQRTIDEFLTGEGINPDKVENLKEIVKYIEDHGAEYSALVEDLNGLSDAIDLLNSDAETAGSVAKAVADAEGRINATIEANEKVTAEALTELDGRVDALEALSAGTEISGIKGRLDVLETEVNTNIPQDIADAQAAAEATAAADATSKANAAQAAAEAKAAELANAAQAAGEAAAATAKTEALSEAKSYTDGEINALEAKINTGLQWVEFK